MIEKGVVPEIQVGVFSAREIVFTLNGVFIEKGSGKKLTGKLTAVRTDDRIKLVNREQEYVYEAPADFVPLDPAGSSLVLHGVTIGVDFHWERREDQVFRGSLRLIAEGDNLTAVNIVSVEDYLISVISSEMKATSSEEFLKAHAVTSRSWLLAQLSKSLSLQAEGNKFKSFTRSGDEIIKWYDREDHANFDVCADDHCQRYQGITRASSPAVVKVINDTYGEVLTYGGTICDTRYYKCCGGITELFENTWEPVNHPYLQGVIDSTEPPAGFNTDLSDEKNAREWILGNPDAFCNTSDKKVLSQVLNDYDQETNDFYRWKVVYTQEELSMLVMERSGIDFGLITGLIPLERGPSGRISRLRIEGSKASWTIGKELEIRKSLSKSHLYSSCFVVDREYSGGKIRFVIHGAGWGHGVGLCQIGAAMMGARGYSYRDILMHYFRGAGFEKLYNSQTA
ncbi:MAG: SpoIID/LytB domain-containing protein [Bacteroidales bacterium]|nr:SpoIID/LytB domain-containing protein [Bacteroidales bacterium]